MQKLTTTQIIESIKRNIWWIIIPAILIGGLIFGKTVLSADPYEAEAVLIVTSNDDGPITYNKLILNEKLASVYGQFLESDDLYNEVEKKLGSDIEADDIADNLSYEVNPQGGVITFTYNDKNEARAKDTLTFVTEEFRAYAAKFLNMENIEYLQSVEVKGGSKTRGGIFSLAGLILGAILGLLLLIIKEILSDRINSADDISELGIEVLADLTKDSRAEGAKIFKKLKQTSDGSVIGLSPLGKITDDKVFEMLANELKAPIIDPEDVRGSDDGLLDIKYKINKFGQDYPYIFIKEESIDDPLPIYLSDLEDYKIVLVNQKSTNKQRLLNEIREFERLGIRVLGVVYY